MGLLAEWTDSGIPIKYFLGNHDPWHRDYFEKELGVHVVPHDSVERLGQMRVYVTHGDGLGEGAKPYALLKPILRHPIPVAVYTGLLPSDTGLGIAKWYSKTFRKETLNKDRVDALRAASRELLSEKNTDVVVMGHSHHPEVSRWDEGVYVNPGSWYMDKTVAIIDHDETSIWSWNGSVLQPYSQD
jgi:UDP-2,3-diacylglucosamine hydrolase